MGLKSRQLKKEGKSLQGFAKLITFLDGYAALAVVDPVKIERLMKGSSSDDLQNFWKQAKDDVYKIGGLPSSSPQIVRLAKWLNIVKILFLFTGLIGVGVWVLLSRLEATFFSGRNAPLIFFGVLIVLFNTVLFLYYALNKRLSMRVITYYDKHAGEVTNQRKHLRQVAQQIIDNLTMTIRRTRYDPKNYEFKLFHSDYRNIKVLKESKGIYHAHVAARSESEK